jgi:hypothetical protein
MILDMAFLLLKMIGDRVACVEAAVTRFSRLGRDHYGWVVLLFQTACRAYDQVPMTISSARAGTVFTEI